MLDKRFKSKEQKEEDMYLLKTVFVVCEQSCFYKSSNYAYTGKINLADSVNEPCGGKEQRRF